MSRRSLERVLRISLYHVTVLYSIAYIYIYIYIDIYNMLCCVILCYVTLCYTIVC